MRCLFRRARFVALAWLVVLWALSPRSVRAQLEVDRLEVYLLSSDGPNAGTFSVTNVSQDPLTARLLIADWERGRDGLNVFSEAGTVEGSCHPNLTVFPATALLSPGETQTVQVTYDGPPLETSCWASVRVTAGARPQQTSGGVQLSLEVQHFVKVYVQPPGGQPYLDLVHADIVPGAPETEAVGQGEFGYQVMALVTNSGTVQARVKGAVEYRTVADSVVARSAVDEFPILPGASRELDMPLPVLSAGSYVVLVLLDYGAPEILATQIDLDLVR